MTTSAGLNQQMKDAKLLGNREMMEKFSEDFKQQINEYTKTFEKVDPRTLYTVEDGILCDLLLMADHKRKLSEFTPLVVSSSSTSGQLGEDRA